MMKKLLIAAAVASLLMGCNSSDAEKKINEISDFSRAESENAANVVQRAALQTATYIFNACTVNGTLAPATLACNNAADPKGMSNVAVSDADFTIAISSNVIKVTFDDAGSYFTYNDGDNLRISYSDEGSLSHNLTIDASTLMSPTVSFDGEFINSDGSFGAKASNLALNPSSSLTGDITVKTKDSYTFTY